VLDLPLFGLSYVLTILMYLLFSYSNNRSSREQVDKTDKVLTSSSHILGRLLDCKRCGAVIMPAKMWHSSNRQKEPIVATLPPLNSKRQFLTCLTILMRNASKDQHICTRLELSIRASGSVVSAMAMVSRSGQTVLVMKATGKTIELTDSASLLTLMAMSMKAIG